LTVHFKHSIVARTALNKMQQVINFPYSIGAELQVRTPSCICSLQWDCSLTMLGHLCGARVTQSQGCVKSLDLKKSSGIWKGLWNCVKKTAPNSSFFVLSTLSNLRGVSFIAASYAQNVSVELCTCSTTVIQLLLCSLL